MVGGMIDKPVVRKLEVNFPLTEPAKPPYNTWALTDEARKAIDKLNATGYVACLVCEGTKPTTIIYTEKFEPKVDTSKGERSWSAMDYTDYLLRSYGN